MNITVQSVSHAFVSGDGSEKQVLSNLSLSVPSGSVVRILGRSGSGKSTLFNIISGMIVPDSGSVTVGDTVISSLSEGARDRFRAQSIGYIFQTFNLLSALTALENVYVPLVLSGQAPANAKQKAVALLDELGLAGHYAHHPWELSVGQRQRVAVARILLQNPDIIIADEPTASLDKQSSQNVRDALFNMHKKGATLLIASHDPLFDGISGDVSCNLEEVAQ